MSILNTADAKSHTWKSQFKKKKPNQQTQTQNKQLMILANGY